MPRRLNSRSYVRRSTSLCSPARAFGPSDGIPLRPGMAIRRRIGHERRKTSPQAASSLADSRYDLEVMTVVQFRQMTDTEYNEWRGASVEGYAQERARNLDAPL